MPRPSRLAQRWLPRRTVRMRLTALYGGLFLIAGALLLTVTYVLVASHIDNAGIRVGTTPRGLTIVSGSQPLKLPPPGGIFQTFSGTAPPSKSLVRNARFIQAVVAAQRSHDLRVLLLGSGAALTLMAIASIGLGWIVAGRVLAPLRTMTATTRQISAENLDERLSLTGPDDELKELGDTIDGLLARLERAFDAQRRFVANASHELRTPLTLERAMIEVALADPSASVSSLREVCQRVLATGAEQERLIEALLMLARSQRGVEHREPVELHAVTAQALAELAAAHPRREVAVTSKLEPASTGGDQRLIKRLVVNLIDNALRHNAPGGWMHVSTQAHNGTATLEVSNGGAVIAEGEVESLLEPFRRRAPDRSAHGPGHGLGLSIVAAIATAHGAELCAAPREGGGLNVTVRFPRAAD